MSGSVNRIVLQTLSRNQSPRTQSNDVDVSTTHDGSVITAGSFDFQSRHHNDNTDVWACSPSTSSFSRRDISTAAFTTNDFREFLGDRKGMYDHLKPRPLIISTMRVVVLQGSVTLATFLTDQLEMETEREELVVQGKISPEEADRENEEWERREWSLRWKSYPRRAFHGILKFHAITVLMRFYEHMAHILYTEQTLDKLTKDTFKSALRKADRLGSSAADNDNNKRELGRQMFATCLWANLISFLADYSVQQIILGYGYFVYYRQCRSRRRRKSRREGGGSPTSPQNGIDNNNNGVEREEDEPKSNETVENGAMAMSLMLKSTKLMLSRSVGLVAASAGGAVGTMLYPGWGTLFGTQMGDALVGSVLD